ncbi:MAG: phosphopantothenoylcysteine decarboxylase [Planctomycetota bacterium]
MTEILVTAGPTREHLDDVRFLSNPSTGRMGYAIAAVAAAMGHRVHLVSGPVELPTPPGVERIDVISAEDMLAASAAVFPGCSIAFFVAAVADHRPAQRVVGKPAKNLGRYSLELVQNPDIAAILGERKGDRVCVGFALESFSDAESRSAAIERARRKIVRKNFDVCVLNGPSALGGDRSEVILIAADGTVQPLPHGEKRQHARVLIERALSIASARRGHTES